MNVSASASARARIRRMPRPADPWRGAPRRAIRVTALDLGRARLERRASSCAAALREWQPRRPWRHDAAVPARAAPARSRPPRPPSTASSPPSRSTASLSPPGATGRAGIVPLSCRRGAARRTPYRKLCVNSTNPGNWRRPRFGARSSSDGSTWTMYYSSHLSVRRSRHFIDRALRSRHPRTTRRASASRPPSGTSLSLAPRASWK